MGVSLSVCYTEVELVNQNFDFVLEWYFHDELSSFSSSFFPFQIPVYWYVYLAPARPAVLLLLWFKDTICCHP